MRFAAIAFFAFAASAAQFDIPRRPFLIDEVVPIVVSGLEPRSRVTIRVHNDEWASSGEFTADANGVVAPADPMQLFWSAKRVGDVPSMTWVLSAEAGGTVVATATIVRRTVADDVAVQPVRERGLAGVFYKPAGEWKHPAVLVLGGSNGGIPPASGAAGGLASRGYAVLALAYFGAEGLPESLTNIPLEYFGTAIEWLASQPSVDDSRIGVLGTSRGGELALLLASIYPKVIRSVVAYVPSSVVVAGCCSGLDQPSWTIDGRPIAYVFPRMRNDFARRSRAAIPVERIGGAILLISGKDDKVWPSSPMSDEIMARLRSHHFAHPYEHLTYDDAGHAIGRPFTSTMEINSVRRLGGTPAGTAHARADSWQHVLKFLDANLKR